MKKLNNPIVLIGIDTETDVGSFTPFYEGVKRGTPKLLKLFAELDVVGTFYFTGHAAKNNPDIAKLVASSPNEVGAHSLYHETIGDELFDLPGTSTLLPSEVYGRLELMTKWIEDVSGVRPKSFRSPRLWGSTEVVRSLERLNYTSDASYPMYFYKQRFAPYFPSLQDWTQEGDSKVLEIPNFADMLMESNDKPLERDRDQWPQFRTKGADFVLDKSKKFIEFIRQKNLPPVICFYIHPWEFVEMPTKFDFGEAVVEPYSFVTQNCGDYALNQLKQLIIGLKNIGCEFHTADSIAQMFKK